MPLVTLRSVLMDAQKGRYAVPSFNFSGIEDLRGILDAAQEVQSPVIVMTSVNIGKYWGLKGIAGYLRGMCEDIAVPVVLHQDHTKDFETLKMCIDLGYTSVMIDGSELSFDENIKITNRVCCYAHQFGVSVEAELGHVAGAEEGAGGSEELLTHPEDAMRFTALTDVDALAVAVGTAHGFYTKPPKLDYDRLKRIRELVDVPLVLHGGSGVPEADFVHSIQCGITKINVGTELRSEIMKNLKEKFDPFEVDIRKLVSSGRARICNVAKIKMELFGSAGKAEKWF